jgi:hypothetical protein
MSFDGRFGSLADTRVRIWNEISSHHPCCTILVAPGARDEAAEALAVVNTDCAAPYGSPRNACDAHGRQWTPHSGLGTRDKSRSAGNRDLLPEIEAERTNCGGQQESSDLFEPGHCHPFTAKMPGNSSEADCSAPRRPPRDACHANGRQRAANCSLSGGDKAMNAWDPDLLPELEAECTNDASQ